MNFFKRIPKDVIVWTSSCFLAALVTFWLTPLSIVNFLILYLIGLLLCLIRNRVNYLKLADYFFCCVGALFIFFSASTNFPKFEFQSHNPGGQYINGYMNMLASQFLEGKLSMPQVPDERLLKMSNPYPVQNRPNIPVAWDCSLFEGKYYLYWGIAPILALLLPYRLITGNYLSEWAAVALFSAIAFVFVYFLVLRLIARLRSVTPDIFERFLIFLSLLFSSGICIAIRRPCYYEVAIFSGLAFFISSIYFLIQKRFFISGLLFGLAFASRPSWAIGGLVFAFFLMKRKKWPEYRNAFLSWGAGLAPLVLVVLLYNFARFHNPFEFGSIYQLNFYPMQRRGLEFKDEVVGLLAYFFSAPGFKDFFPCLSHLPPGVTYFGWWHHMANEGIYGALYLAPMILFVFAWRLFKSLRGHQKLDDLTGFFVVSVILSLLIARYGMTARYSAELITFFLIPTLAFAFSENFGKLENFVMVMLISMILFGVNLGFFASLAYEFSECRFSQYYPQILSAISNLYIW